jgi:hypothetical protein
MHVAVDYLAGFGLTLSLQVPNVSGFLPSADVLHARPVAGRVGRLASLFSKAIVMVRVDHHGVRPGMRGVPARSA